MRGDDWYRLLIEVVVVKCLLFELMIVVCGEGCM